MHENLKQVLLHVSRFETSILDDIGTYFKQHAIKKGTILLHEGDICNNFYFVNKGCIRTYFITGGGIEKTRYIMPDLHLGTALASFISQSPSTECIDTLSDTELLKISYTDFQQLLNKYDQWRIFYQKILEMAYCFQNTKLAYQTTLSAKQRYQQLLAQNPSIIQQVSNRILASYLDMSQETLSRLKSQ